jgi:hypothetical protein
MESGEAEENLFLGDARKTGLACKIWGENLRFYVNQILFLKNIVFL